MLATLIYFQFKQAQRRLKVTQSLCLCIDAKIATTSTAGALVMSRVINTVITLTEEADCYICPRCPPIFGIERMNMIKASLLIGLLPASLNGFAEEPDWSTYKQVLSYCEPSIQF
jgi:hypothetical protein